MVKDIWSDIWQDPGPTSVIISYPQWSRSLERSSLSCMFCMVFMSSAHCCHSLVLAWM